MNRLIRNYLWALLAVTLCLTACDGGVRVGAVEFGIEPTATLVPTPTLTPTPSPAIEVYRNDAYGFAFDYLSTWTLSEEPHAIRLRQDTLQLYIGYRWATETIAITAGRTGMPAGDWIYGDKVFFLGQVVPAQVLEYQRKDKAVFYGGTDLIQTEDLVFAIHLEDLDGAQYEELDLPKRTQAEVKNVLESFRRVPATGQPPAPSPTPLPVPTRAPPPVPSSDEAVAVVGWYGSVHSAPAGSGYDDYLLVLPILSPDGTGTAEVGLVAASPADEAAIAELRDKEPPNRYAHFWGTLTCGVDDYGGCRLEVTHLRPDGPGPMLNPDPVEGWEGTVITSSAWAQIDDAFVLGGDYPVHYGIWSEDAELDQSIQRYRNSGIPIRVWGQLLCGVPDAGGCQIQVNRLEEALATEVPAPEQPWAGYENAEFGFSFRYPASWTLEEVPGRDLPQDPKQPPGAMPLRCADGVVLRQDTLAISIQYLRRSEDGPIAWCEMATIHEPTHREQVTVMEEEATWTALVDREVVKAVDVYVNDVAGLSLLVTLRDGGETAFTASEMKALPVPAVADLSRILSSFERME